MGVDRIDSSKYLIELMDRYSNLVYSICYKITKNSFDAQDLTQETFLAAYKNLSSFDGINEKAWIAKIATNKGLDYLKSAGKRNLPTQDTYFSEIKSSQLTPEESFFENDSKEDLLKICKELKPPYDEIATNYFYHEMTIKEISETFGKKTKTIQTQVYRAKAFLKKRLEKGDVSIGK